MKKEGRFDLLGITLVTLVVFYGALYLGMILVKYIAMEMPL